MDVKSDKSVANGATLQVIVLTATKKFEELTWNLMNF
jgi:hypothetical protein